MGEACMIYVGANLFARKRLVMRINSHLQCGQLLFQGIFDPLGLDTGLPHAGMTAVGFVGWAKLAGPSGVAD
jgi:hypothetical protein